MSYNILVTGGSGYLGGTLLARWQQASLPSVNHVFALVRTDKQADAVRKYGVEPIFIDLQDQSVIHDTIVAHNISIIFWLIGIGEYETQACMIRALAEVQTQTGREVHFLQTGGAKQFSSFTGHPVDRPLLDTDPELYNYQKTLKGPVELLNNSLSVNNAIIDIAEKHGVKSYIFVPCIVYGEGEGFGNRISIQTVAVVKAAVSLRKACNPDAQSTIWPVCHVIDNTTLYLQILRQILLGKDIGHGKNGYFLAASGNVAWDDIYRSFAQALFKRGKVDSDTVHDASSDELAHMGKALDCPPELVTVQMGGMCTLTAAHGRQIGWEHQYPSEHMIETADSEVDFILQNLKT